jgi:hypothetical protein
MHFYTGARVLGISVLFQVHVTVISSKCDSRSMISLLMPRCGLFGALHFTKYVLVLVHRCCMQCTAKVSSGRSRALCCCSVSFLHAAHSHWYRLSIPLAFLHCISITDVDEIQRKRPSAQLSNAEQNMAGSTSPVPT